MSVSFERKAFFRRDNEIVSFQEPQVPYLLSMTDGASNGISEVP